MSGGEFPVKPLPDLHSDRTRIRIQVLKGKILTFASPKYNVSPPFLGEGFWTLTKAMGCPVEIDSQQSQP